MKGIMSVMLGLVLFAGPSIVRADMDHKGHKHDQTEKEMQGDACQKHCSGMQLRSEVEALEKELKQVQSTGGKLIEIENRKVQLRKHIAQHQEELKDLQGRLDGKMGAEKAAMYQCSMKCTAPQDKPGRCPKCGMNMEKMK
jgi:septal ring factor EnvC (AmiA/AmiB activator)